MRYIGNVRKQDKCSSLTAVQGVGTSLAPQLEHLESRLLLSSTGPAYLDWSSIPANISADAPLPLTLTARDQFGATADYNGPLYLMGQVPARTQSIGYGVGTMGGVLGGNFIQQRAQVIYVRSELGAAGTIGSLSLQAVGSFSAPATQWTIRIKHTALSGYMTNEAFDSTGWTTVYQGTANTSSSGWVDFLFQTPFDYNGADNLMIDFCLDAPSFNTVSTFQSAIPVSPYRTLYRTNSSASKDIPPTQWSTGGFTAFYPTIRLSFGTNVPVTAESQAGFVHGVWNGTVSAHAIASGMVLRAEYGGQYICDHNAINVQDPGAAIKGLQWHDRNGDGVQQAGDEGLAGRIVYADQNGNGVRDVLEPFAITGADGSYVLHVAAGTYTVAQVAAAGWHQTTPQGSRTITVGPSQVVSNVNFASDELPGEIRGNFWDDANTNGVHDQSEQPLAGWTAYLDLNGNYRLDSGEPTAVTDANGDYVFSNLDPGTYDVYMSMPTGWKHSSPSDLLYVATNSPLLGGGTRMYEFDARTGAQVRYIDFANAPLFVGGICEGPDSLFVLGISGPFILYELDKTTGAVIDADVLPSNGFYYGAGYLDGMIYISRPQGGTSYLDVWDPRLDKIVQTFTFPTNGFFDPTGAPDLGILLGSLYEGVGTLDPRTGQTQTLLPWGTPPLNFNYNSYLAYCNGELLLVQTADEQGLLLSQPVAYRLDPLSMKVLGTAKLNIPYDGSSVTWVGGNGGGQNQRVKLSAGQSLPGIDFGSYDSRPTVVGRQVFYNNSEMDGSNPAANTGDDAAIATDKSPLIPGDTVTSANRTGYDRGINGVMVDLRHAAGTATANDFSFRVSSGDGVWKEAPAPSSVTVRNGVGIDGSDRVTITWPDGAIEGQWLEVTVKKGGNTGLTQDDVFCFGNLPGDADSNGLVDFNDYLALEGAFGTTGAFLTADFDANGRVDFSDYLVLEAAFGSHLPDPVWGMTGVQQVVADDLLQIQPSAMMALPNVFSSPSTATAEKSQPEPSVGAWQSDHVADAPADALVLASPKQAAHVVSPGSGEMRRYWHQRLPVPATLAEMDQAKSEWQLFKPLLQSAGE